MNTGSLERMFRTTTVGSNILQTDNEGNKAPGILSDWLFKDDCYNQKVKNYSVATREEVYTKWGL